MFFFKANFCQKSTNKKIQHYYQSGVQFTNLNHYETLKVK